MSDAEPELLTVPEVAAQLRVSKMTVYRLVESGEIPSMRIGRSIRIPADTLPFQVTGGRR